MLAWEQVRERARKKKIHPTKHRFVPFIFLQIYLKDGKIFTFSMANNQETTPLDAMSIAVEALSKLENTSNQNIAEKLTPATLVSAIKLAAIADEVTPDTVTQAVQLADETKPEQEFTAESLAMALKLVAKASKEVDEEQSNASPDQILAAARAAMKAAVTLQHVNEQK